MNRLIHRAPSALQTRRASWPRHLAFAVVTLVVLSAFPAMASELESNLVLMPVQSFTGTTDSIPIPPSLTGGVEGVQTGPITLSLAPNTIDVFGLDNVLQQGHIDVTLQLSSPLFTELGETPLIHIVETGPASVTYPTTDLVATPSTLPPYDFLFQAFLTGGGTVENGLFAGTTFHNVNAYEGQGINGSWIVQPGSTVTWDIQHNGSVTFPDGTTISEIGGSGNLVIAPEPSSWLLLAVGSLALGLMRYWSPRR